MLWTMEGRLKRWTVGLILSLVLLGSPASATEAVDEDVLMSVASAELERLWGELSEQPEAAYWIELGIVDRSVVEVQATHGAASAVSGYRVRLADVDLRVGTPELDNTHKLRDAGWFSGEQRPQIDIPFTDEPDAIRVGIWRATDQAYRSAVRRLIKVRANQSVKVDRE
ncbi:MAG: TldD protein, partial [Myxococcota bacterium]